MTSEFLGRCRYHIFRLAHMAYSDVFFRRFFMEISWGPLGPTRFFQISRPTRPCWEPALIDGTAVWGAWVTWSYGTVDGCEILHHQKDGRNPINNGIFTTYQLVQDFWLPSCLTEPFRTVVGWICSSTRRIFSAVMEISESRCVVPMLWPTVLEVSRAGN